jgi:hypothetical protein
LRPINQTGAVEEIDGRTKVKHPCKREDEDGGVGYSQKAETELESKCGRRGRSWSWSRNTEGGDGVGVQWLNK